MHFVFRFLKKQIDLILICIFILSGSLSLFHSDKFIFQIGFGIIGFLIFLYFILFNKKWIIYLCAFVIPLSTPQSILGDSTISFPSEALALLIATFYLLKNLLNFTINKKIIFHPISLILIFQIFWMIVSSCTSTLPIVSFKRSAITIMYVVVYYFMMTEFFVDRNRIINLFFAFGAGIIFPIIYCIIKHSQLNFVSTAAYQMCQPYFIDHTIYGACIVFLLPVFLGFIIYRKVFYISKVLNYFVIAFVIILFVASILSYSRAAWLSLIISFTIFLLIRIRIRLYVLLSVALISSMFLLFSFETILKSIQQNEIESNKSGNGITEHIESLTNIQTDVSNLERINRWKCALRMFKDKPITGFGPGTFQFNYGEYQLKSEMTRISTYKGNKGHAHSEYLNYLSESGLAGAIGILLFVFFNVSTSIKIIRVTTDTYILYLTSFILIAQLTYFIHAFFNGFLDCDKIAMLVYSSSAAIVTLDLRTRNDEIN